MKLHKASNVEIFRIYIELSLSLSYFKRFFILKLSDFFMFEFEKSSFLFTLSINTFVKLTVIIKSGSF
jgi:hypothetical protein